LFDKGLALVHFENIVSYRNGSLAHSANDHSHSQRPVFKGFPLSKRCEWAIQPCPF